MRTINQQLATGCEDASGSGSSRRGHRLVCILCGRSLISRQSHLVVNENQSELQRQMSFIVETRIMPRQVLISVSFLSFMLYGCMNHC